jgi:hypothetical protein
MSTGGVPSIVGARKQCRFGVHDYILFAVGFNTPPLAAVKFGNANKKW